MIDVAVAVAVGFEFNLKLETSSTLRAYTPAFLDRDSDPVAHGLPTADSGPTKKTGSPVHLYSRVVLPSHDGEMRASNSR